MATKKEQKRVSDAQVRVLEGYGLDEDGARELVADARREGGLDRLLRLKAEKGD